MEIKRLFDCIDYQLTNFPQEAMLAGKENGNWRKYSTQEVAQTANELSAGLLSLGLSANDFTPEGSDKIAIISSNRPEWLIADMATQQIGVIWVPVYPTTNPLELTYYLNDDYEGGDVEFNRHGTLFPYTTLFRDRKSVV